MGVYLPDTGEFQKDIILLADLTSYSAQHKTKPVFPCIISQLYVVIKCSATKRLTWTYV